MCDLVRQFVKQECTAYVRHLLEDAIADLAAPRLHFEFNRFEITVDRQANVVVLEDVLDPSPTGVRRVPLEEFSSALKESS